MPSQQKPRTNLTLAQNIRKMADKMRVDDHRPSLVNFIETLILEEASRRGIGKNPPSAHAQKKVA